MPGPQYDSEADGHRCGDRRSPTAVAARPARPRRSLDRGRNSSCRAGALLALVVLVTLAGPAVDQGPAGAELGVGEAVVRASSPLPGAALAADVPEGDTGGDDAATDGGAGGGAGDGPATTADHGPGSSAGDGSDAGPEDARDAEPDDATDDRRADEPAADQPPADQPTGNQPADDQPAADEPAGEDAADAAGGDEAPDDSRAAYVAARLRRDPVFISPSLTRIASPAAVAALRKRVAAMPYPTYVAVLPQFTEDPDVETLSQLIPLLRDRVGRDGLYLVADGSGYGLEAAAIGVRTKGDVGRAGLVAGDGLPRGSGPLAEVDVALRHLATGYVPEFSLDEQRAAEDRLPWIVMAIATAVGFLVPVGAVLAGPKAWARRRALRDLRRQAAADAAGAAMRFDAPEQAAARGEALDAVAGLARAIAEHPDPADRALRAYEAASHVLSRRAPDTVDLVGAATLARLGRAWLRDPAWRPCFFDPRHGQGGRSTRWRRGGQDVTIPTCGDCAKALRRGTEPQVLGDAGRPYFERDTVWARTGFGALDDEVAEIVLAGPAGRS